MDGTEGTKPLFNAESSPRPAGLYTPPKSSDIVSPKNPIVAHAEYMVQMTAFANCRIK